MKLRHSLSIFGLVAMLGLGVGVGLSSNGEVKEAKAATYKGKIFVDTTYATYDGDYNNWRESGAKVTVHMWDNDSHSHTFDAQAFNHVEGKYYINTFEYDLEWNPTGMLVRRTDSTGSSEWSKTADISFSNIVIVGKNCSYETQSFASVTGDISFTTDSFSRDSTHDNHVMHSKTGVAVTKGNKFQVSFGGITDYHALRDGVSASAFEVEGDYIVAKATGNYDFFFDTAASGTGSKQLWVEENAELAATTFATTFISTTDGICKDTSKVAVDTDLDDLAAVWNAKAQNPDGTSLVEKWNALTAAAKSVFATGTANETVKDAHDRYVHIMRRYSATLTAFTNGPSVSPSSLVTTTDNVLTNNSTTIVLIVVASITVLLVAGGFFYLRKRREDR